MLCRPRTIATLYKNEKKLLKKLLHAGRMQYFASKPKPKPNVYLGYITDNT